MTEIDFWAVIEECRPDDLDGGTGMAADLMRALEAHGIDGCREFQTLLQAKVSELNSWDVLGPAMIVGLDDEDDFLAFRLWAIAQGQEFFERTLEDSEWLAEVETEDPLSEWTFEDLAQVAARAFEKLSDEDWDLELEDLDSPTGTECSDDEDSLRERFPKLVETFSAEDD